MNPSKWKALLNIQEVHGECHPGLAKAYIDLFSIRIPPPLKILELGLGEGILEFRMLKDRGYDVTGVTIRPWQAQAISPADGRVYCMDMHDLKFKPESFEAIFSAVTLEHSYAPWMVALESWIVLKPSGILFFIVPRPDQYHVVTHPCLLTCDQWSSILRYAGFEVLIAENYTFDVECSCERSDMDNSPTGTVFHHSETMMVFIARKSIPFSEEVSSTIAKLLKVHQGKGRHV